MLEERHQSQQSSQGGAAFSAHFKWVLCLCSLVDLTKLLFRYSQSTHTPRTTLTIKYTQCNRYELFARWQHINSDNACLVCLPIQSGLWSRQGTVRASSTHSLQLPSCHILYALYSIRLSWAELLPHFIAQWVQQILGQRLKAALAAADGHKLLTRKMPQMHWAAPPAFPALIPSLPPSYACLRHITPQFNYELVFEFIMPLSKRGRPITLCTPLAALSRSISLSLPVHLPPPFAFYLPKLRSSWKFCTWMQKVRSKSAQFTFLTFAVYPKKEPGQLNRTQPHRTEPYRSGLGIPQLPELCCCQRGFCAAVTTHAHTKTRKHTHRHTP